MRAVQLALSFALAMTCAAARAELSEVPIRAATLAWQWHPDSLHELRLTMPNSASHRLSPEPGVRLLLRDGQSIAMRGERFGMTGWSFVLRGRTHRVGPMQLALTRGAAFEFALRDADGQDWLRLDHALPQADLRQRR